MFGRNALIWSVHNSHLDCAMLLLSYTSDINHRDNEGKTVLMHVCEIFQPSMTTLFDVILSNKQLNIDTVDEDGWTVLHCCSVNGHIQLIKKFITKLSLQPHTINRYDNYGKNSAMLAANRGRLEVLKELLRKGSTVDSVDKDGKSGLMLAVRRGHCNCVIELCRNGADINRVDSDGQSALFLSTSNYHVNCVKVLLGLGCMLQYQSNNNNVLNVIANDEVLVNVLIAAGCTMDSSCVIQSDGNEEHEVVPLMEQCRSCIRYNLVHYIPTSNFSTLVERLLLPRPLKRFLVYDIKKMCRNMGVSILKTGQAT